MWSAKDRNYIYRDVLEEFYRYIGTDIPMDNVFNIKVNINKDPEGCEKLRQTMIGFFNGIDLYHYYTEELGFVGLTEFDTAIDFINEMSKKGRGANSPLRLIYIVVTNFIKWVADAPRTIDQQNWTIEIFMKLLQKYIKPVRKI